MGNSCSSSCPADYFPYDPQMMCLECATECVNATLTIYIDAPNRVFIDIEFTHPVSFSSAEMENFQEITFDAPITLSMFTVTYSLHTAYIYRISLTPLSTTDLNANNLNVAVLDFTTGTHYSDDGYQFSPDIYDLEDTLEWTYIHSQADSNTTQN